MAEAAQAPGEELAGAAEHAGEEAGGYATGGEYINHHLQFLTYGKHADGHWGFGQRSRKPLSN